MRKNHWVSELRTIQNFIGKFDNTAQKMQLR